MGIVVEETDETIFWLELMSDTEIVAAKRLTGLINEADQLLRIFTASKKTADRHRAKQAR
jgi:hypothetical protein